MPARFNLRLVRRSRGLVVIAAAALVASALAQSPPPVSIAPPAWRAPVLQVTGAEQPVRLTSLKVEVEVAAGVAETRVQMVLLNPNSRALEGKLQFPLAAGQIVSGFALDVDGRCAPPCRSRRRTRSKCSRTSPGAASTPGCCRRRSATTTSCASIR